jgi:outer membrane protein insertion porin family
MLNKKAHIMLILCAGMLFSASSCSNLRYLEEGSLLFVDSKVEIATESEHDREKYIRHELESVIRPVPNQRFLFWRPRLWLYNVAGEPRGKGLRHLMRNRYGRPPVLFNESDLERNLRLMQNRLFNMGYFDAGLKADVVKKEQTAAVHYSVFLPEPYRLAEIFPLEADDSLGIEINLAMQETGLREGKPYRLEDLKAERDRIDEHLKKKGYFYFHPDFLMFRADSSAGNRQVDLYPTLKAEMPSPARHAFIINKVEVFADYLGGGEAAQAVNDTTLIREGLYLYERGRKFNPELFLSAIAFTKGKLYNSDDHSRTLNRLTGLGVFRFVNLRFTETTYEGQAALDVRVLLSPAERKSLSAEIRGVSKSNNFAGPGLTAAFTDINFLGGAERFRVTFNAAYETLFGSQFGSATSWDTGLEAELSVPRFLIPFKDVGPGGKYVPKTSFALSMDYLSRTDAFSLTTLGLRYGYGWTQNIYTQYRVFPLVFSLFSLGNVHPDVMPLFEGGDLRRRGLFEQFIIGGEYSLYYNSQLRSGVERRHNLYFNMNANLSGNLAWLLADKVLPANKAAGEEYQVWGKGFSQFARADFDLRHYWSLSRKEKLASRLVAGVGVPYGNSDQLPYSKMFTIGGSNSIRAFHPRMLGPGTYLPPDSLLGSFNLFRTGEIKLEASVEYRFDITRMLKGAFFLDAGNIWRIHEDEDTPGGQFAWSSFAEQLALGAGTGLRLDATFFILRFDFAFPLAIPYSEHPGFFEPITPFRDRWLRNNIVFNLAIGYPF